MLRVYCEAGWGGACIIAYSRPVRTASTTTAWTSSKAQTTAAIASQRVPSLPGPTTGLSPHSAVEAYTAAATADTIMPTAQTTARVEGAASWRPSACEVRTHKDLFVLAAWDMVVCRLGLDEGQRKIDDAVYGEFLRRVGEAITRP